MLLAWESIRDERPGYLQKKAKGTKLLASYELASYGEQEGEARSVQPNLTLILTLLLY